MDPASPTGAPSFSRWPFWISLAMQIGLLALLTFYDEWTGEENPIRFAILAILAGVFFLHTVSQFGAADFGGRTTLLFLVSGSALAGARAAGRTGDDLWRYQWEGKIQGAGFNPYLLAPEAPELEQQRAEFPDWSRINHREYRAIYPAGAELLFRALSAASATPLVYKILFAAADLLVIFLLVRVLGGSGHLATAAWYAWNPLVVYSFAGAAHFDSLMLAPLLGAVLLIVKSNDAMGRPRRWWLATGAAVLLGLAISIKLVPILLLLLFAFALRARAVTLLLAVAIPMLLSLPFGFPQVRIWESLGDFAYVTRLNDLFWWVIEEAAWPNPRQKNYQYNVVLLVAVAVVSLLFWRDWKRGLLWVIGIALLLAPVLHPWYCTWILPFATWRRAFAWHVLSVTLFAYYLFWAERLFMLPWHSELWLRTIIIVPPLLVLAIALVTPRKNLPAPAAEL